MFKECTRILKPGGRLALTNNLDGHWKEFYTLFESSLKTLNKSALIKKLNQQQTHRGTVESISKLFTDSHLTVTRHFTENFEMKFLDGTAFLNHYFVKLGWLGSWLELIPKEELERTFTLLETNLNAYAKTKGGLTLTVPMVFIEGEKIPRD